MTPSRINGSADGFTVLAFFTADHAVVEGGKVYINGGFFERIYQPAFPAQISIAVVALIDISPEQFLQDHRFTVEMEDASGSKLTDFKIDGGFRVAPSPDSRAGESGRMPLAVPLTGVSLPSAGDYWFVFSINGDELARYRVRAAQVGAFTQQLPQGPNGDGSGSQEKE